MTEKQELCESGEKGVCQNYNMTLSLVNHCCSWITWTRGKLEPRAKNLLGGSWRGQEQQGEEKNDKRNLSKLTQPLVKVEAWGEHVQAFEKWSFTSHRHLEELGISPFPAKYIRMGSRKIYRLIILARIVLFLNFRDIQTESRLIKSVLHDHLNIAYSFPSCTFSGLLMFSVDLLWREVFSVDLLWRIFSQSSIINILTWSKY